MYTQIHIRTREYCTYFIKNETWCAQLPIEGDAILMTKAEAYAVRDPFLGICLLLHQKLPAAVGASVAFVNIETCYLHAEGRLFELGTDTLQELKMRSASILHTHTHTHTHDMHTHTHTHARHMVYYTHSRATLSPCP